MGALPNVFPGYQQVDDQGRGQVRSGLGSGKLPDKNGLMMPQMMERPCRRQHQGLLCLRREPGQHRAGHPPRGDIAWIRPSSWSARIFSRPRPPALPTLSFPAAAWSENDGTFTNSERRVQQGAHREQPRRARPSPTGGYSERSRGAHGTSMDVRQRPGIYGTTRYPSSPRHLAGIKYARTGKRRPAVALPRPNHPGTPVPAQGRVNSPAAWAVHASRLDPARRGAGRRISAGALTPAAGSTTTIPAPRPGGPRA